MTVEDLPDEVLEALTRAHSFDNLFPHQYLCTEGTKIVTNDGIVERIRGKPPNYPVLLLGPFLFCSGCFLGHDVFVFCFFCNTV
jgi:hypothetical protein